LGLGCFSGQTCYSGIQYPAKLLNVPPTSRRERLADAPNNLGNQLQAHLRELAVVVKPHSASLDRKFVARLRKLGFDARERDALTKITPGSASQLFGRRAQPMHFFEQVEAAGKCLAKLNVPPSAIVSALQEYDVLLAPVLAKFHFEGHPDLQWVREQFHFCVILTLNEAYYRVRESETQAFHEIFRIELESKNTDVLFRRFVEEMTGIFRAEAGHLFLLSEDHRLWNLKASTALGVSEAAVYSAKNTAARLRKLSQPLYISRPAELKYLLDPGWASKYACCWSFPLVRSGKLAGVMQLGFRTEALWLPRDEELLVAAAERCLMAAERARLVEDLAVREQQVRNLAEHMLHVEEMERRRISRELHDEAGQSLVCIRLQMELIEMALPPEAKELAERLAEVRDVTEKTILDMRRLIADLSPVILEQFGLDAAARQLAKRLQSLRNCRVNLVTEGLQELSPKIQIIVYRILQECCNNVSKHSSASNVNISVSSADEVLSLQVEDNGVGFDMGQALTKSDSFGLAGIRERVALLGGKFEIVSRQAAANTGRRGKKSGTEIRIVLPVARDTTW
jgi:signal transduction histidine kinase